LGEGGFGAVIEAQIEPGEVVSAEFLLAGAADPLVLRAVVSYRKGFSHGFEFIGILPEHRERIRAFCRDLQPAPS
jgi:hypothetical protein